MSLFWLCYKHRGKTTIIIQPGQQLMFARLGAGIAGLDKGTFIDGHPLSYNSERDPKEANRPPTFNRRSGESSRPHSAENSHETTQPVGLPRSKADATVATGQPPPPNA